MSIPVPKNIFSELHENFLILDKRLKSIEKALELHQKILDFLCKDFPEDTNI